jgi:2-isopropylmalate synthase
MGVYSVEIFPIVSKDDKEVAKELVKMRRNCKVYFLCRWNNYEIDFALECGADGVIVEGPGNPTLGSVVLGLSEDEMVAKFTAATAHAKKNGIFTSVMPWDTLRAPLGLLERIYKSVVYEAGADHVAIADTFGFALPWTAAHMVRTLREWVPGIPVEMHAHNDFGLATSVMLSAVTGGASVVHTSMNALGERAGNAATEEVVLGLELLLGLDTGVKLERLYPVSNLVAELTKTPNALNKPVVGDNEFTTESGQVAFLIERLTQAKIPYGAYMPELIGRKGSEIVLGKMSGSEVITKKLEKLGLSGTKEQVSEMLDRVKREASLRKWSISDDVFDGIARSVLENE